MQTDTTILVQVLSKTMLTEVVCSFELGLPEGGELPKFTAGAHIDVHTPAGSIRQYSICNPPSERHRYKIAVLRDPESRGGSVAMHDLVNLGDTIKISAPRNHFPLDEEASSSLLIAGGIGITPILSMAEKLNEEKAPFSLYCFSRSKALTAFHHYIKTSDFAARGKFYFDDALDLNPPNWSEILGESDPGKHLYVCGPKGFIDFVLSSARKQGWSESTLHYELFTNENIVLESDAEFQIKIASSGVMLDVPAEATVLSVLTNAGFDIPVSCEQGICGTCLTTVLDGQPDHRDAFLLPSEQAKNDVFTPCCSRSKSPVLVLDL